MRKSILPNITRITRIPKTIVIPKDTGDIKEGYRLPSFIERLFLTRYFYRKPWYSYFDSWDTYKKRLPARYETVPGDPDKGDLWLNKWISTPIRKTFGFLASLRNRFRRKRKKHAPSI